MKLWGPVHSLAFMIGRQKEVFRKLGFRLSSQKSFSEWETVTRIHQAHKNKFGSKSVVRQSKFGNLWDENGNVLVHAVQDFPRASSSVIFWSLTVNKCTWTSSWSFLMFCCSLKKTWKLGHFPFRVKSQNLSSDQLFCPSVPCLFQIKPNFCISVKLHIM